MDHYPIRFDRNADEKSETKIIDLDAFRKEDTVEMTPLEHKIAGNELLKDDYLNGDVQPSDADSTVIVKPGKEYGQHEPTEQEKEALVDFEVRKRLYGVPVIKNGDKFESNGYRHEDGVTPLDKPLQMGRKKPETPEPEAPRQRFKRKKTKDPLDDFFK